MQRRLGVGWCIGSGLADVVAPTSDGRDRVETGNEANKKRTAIFLGCSFFYLRVVCGTERGTSDWNSRAEQRERPEGDRLIALVISLRVSEFESFKVSEFQSFRVSEFMG